MFKVQLAGQVKEFQPPEPNLVMPEIINLEEQASGGLKGDKDQNR